MDVSKIDSVATTNLGNNLTPSTDAVPARQVVAAVHEINKSELMGEGRQLNFTRDPDTKRQVIQIVDQDTGEVVDQISPRNGPATGRAIEITPTQGRLVEIMWRDAYLDTRICWPTRSSWFIFCMNTP